MPGVFVLATVQGEGCTSGQRLHAPLILGWDNLNGSPPELDLSLELELP